MYKTGIRINTLGQLEEKHIDFNNMVINIDGAILKNHQLLKLPLDNQLLRLLLILIQQNQKLRNHYNKNNKYVFISSKGTSLNTRSMNNAISKQLTKYSKLFGLTNINAHALRRAYAKNLLNKGANYRTHFQSVVTLKFGGYNTVFVLGRRRGSSEFERFFIKERQG